MLAGLSAAVLGAGLFLRVIPATPGHAVRTAERFAGLLKSRELEEAYKLTAQQGAVGKSLGEFQDVVDRQWPGGPAADIQHLTVRPFQSYGNRLRRWLQGREVELPELSIEFSVDGVPFEVRERHVGKGEWKVCYFQSHAG